jgi:transposase
MATTHPRKLISDRTWALLEEALQEAKHSSAGAPAALSERDFIEALLYLIRTGSPWRDLPPELGYWHAVYMRFRRWEARGIWQRLWKQLQSRKFSQARELFVDSTTVRAHQHAAGAPKKTVAIRLWDALGAD